LPLPKRKARGRNQGASRAGIAGFCFLSAWKHAPLIHGQFSFFAFLSIGTILSPQETIAHADPCQISIIFI